MKNQTKCKVCGSKALEINVEGFCSNCSGFAQLADSMPKSYHLWMKSLEEDRLYWNLSKTVLSNIIDTTINPSDAFHIQIKAVETILLNEIKKLLCTYRKTDLIAFIMIIKESVRRMNLKPYYNDYIWENNTEYDAANFLMTLVFEISESKFQNNQIDFHIDGHEPILTLLSLSRIYLVFRENCDIVNQAKEISVSLIDLLFKPIENAESEAYFEHYVAVGLDEKAEDIMITNRNLEAKLHKENKSKDVILKKLNGFLDAQYSFNLDDARFFFDLKYLEFLTAEEFESYISSPIIFSEHFPPLLILPKKNLEDFIIECNFEHQRIVNLISMFSLNNIPNLPLLKQERLFELRSFYDTGEYYVFGLFDLIQNLSAFEKFYLNGHFIEYFDPNFKDDAELSKIQKLLSARTAYLIANHFSESGYEVPYEIPNKKTGVKIPRAEIGKIIINGSNILSNYGDIDVISFDAKNDRLIMIELKQYKPAISYENMITGDKKRIEKDEVERKMKNRENIIRSNISEVCTYFGWNYTSTTSVKSLLVTSRANYHGINSPKEFEYYTVSSLMDKISRMEL